MSGFVFVILCGIKFLSCPCQGKIIAPPAGKIFTFLPGSTERITWDFDDREDDLVSRSWTFKSSDGSKPEFLAIILREKEPEFENSSLPGIAIEKPATLVLKNVDLSYNGTYELSISSRHSDKREVTVYIAVAPNVTLCSSSITVDESEPVMCLCTGQGGNPPANVTWYDKNDKVIGGVRKEENLLDIRNVKRTDNGTYKCVAESHPSAKDEKSVVVTVNFKPNVTSLTFNPNTVDIGENVTIECKASGFPAPSYTITLNDTLVLSNEMMYELMNLNASHVGSIITCIATNNLGSDSRSERLPLNKEKTASNKSSDGTKWYIIVVVLVSGFSIGIIFPPSV